jgi:hypothetical protein
MRFRKAGVLATFSLSLVLMSGMAFAATLSKVSISDADSSAVVWSTDSVDLGEVNLSINPGIPLSLDPAAGLYIFSFAGTGVSPDTTNFNIKLYFTDSVGGEASVSLQNANGSMVPPESAQVDLPEDEVSVKALNFVINSFLTPSEDDPTNAQTEGQFILQLSELLTAIDAQIDIKPGSDPNSINLKSRGVIPVALFGSEEFEVRDVDPSSVKFAGAGFRKFSFADVNGDGIEDMMFHFLTQQITDLDSNRTEATVTGLTADGVEFSGTDSVNIVPKGKANGHEKEKKK